MKDESDSPLLKLKSLMARLRDPQTGCPWDRQQTFETIAPYTIEEAYEVADAIARADDAALREELGDLLFQVLFHSRLAEERGLFDLDDVARDLLDKMTGRHPHVFGETVVRNEADQSVAWERQKAEAKREKGHDSVLDDIPLAMPALMRAEKLSKRAGRVGFEWPDLEGVFAKIEEELAELRETFASGQIEHAAARDELGDLFFALANLARYLKVDPEDAVRQTNAKFERRFRAVETELKARGKRPEDSTLAEMDAIWDEIRANDRRQNRKKHTT